MKSNFKDLIASKTKQALGSNLISLEAIKQNIVILDELKAFIPPLNADESTQLEQNIIKYGCKDALLVWETTDQVVSSSNENTGNPAYILIDGHNRYRICTTNHISFNIQLLSFPSIKEVKDYMIDLQLGRRNLTPQQASYFRGLRYQNEKIEKGRYARIEHNAQNEQYGLETANSHNAQNEQYDLETVNNHNAQNEQYGLETTNSHNAQNEQYGKSTAVKLAEEYNVSPVTIRRDADFAAGLNKLDAGLRNDILAGKKNIDKGMLQKLAKIDTVMEPIQDVTQLQELVGTSSKKVIKPVLSFASVEECTLKMIETIQLLEQTKSKTSLADLKKLVTALEQLL